MRHAPNGWRRKSRPIFRSRRLLRSLRGEGGIRSALRLIVDLSPPRPPLRKNLLLADMDSTMIRQECIDELPDFVGLKDKVSAVTERAMRGEIEFEPALRERVALLRGLERDVVDRIVDERIVL